MQKKKKIEESDEVKKLLADNAVLNSNMLWLKQQAEKAGTEKNMYKKQLILLQEKYDRLILDKKGEKK